MNKWVGIGFLGLALFIAGLLGFLDDEKTELQSQNKLKNYFDNWETEFQLNSNDPRNLGFFNDLLHQHTNDSVYELNRWNQLDSIPEHEEATYLFIGNNFGLESDRFDTLLSYVDSGATVIIAFDQMTQNIYDRFFLPNAFFWDYSNTFQVSTEDTTLSFPLTFQNQRVYGDWYTFSELDIIDSNFRTIATAFYEPIAFESKIGKGKLIFHSVPRLFQNVQVYEKNGFTHASLFLDEIAKDHPIIWLELGDLSGLSSNSSSENDENGKPKQDNSLIQFILDAEALRLAFILILVLLLLFVVFRAKRKETILVGLPVQRNMSLAFVETLSSIYSSRKSPEGILQLLRKNFHSAINRHFYIDLNQSEQRDEQIRRIAEKSSCEPHRIQSLIESLDQKKNTVDEKYLATVYRELRSFYRDAGIQRATSHYVAKGKEIQLHRNLISSSLILLFGIMSLIVGLYLLTSGNGIGILLVILASGILTLGIRLISLPVAVIFPTEICMYNLFSAKKIHSLFQGIRMEEERLKTTLHLESGEQISFELIQLSTRARVDLAQFIEHIKQKNT